MWTCTALLLLAGCGNAPGTESESESAGSSSTRGSSSSSSTTSELPTTGDSMTGDSTGGMSDSMTGSWWDYRMLGLQKNRGLRIDHILVSNALKPAIKTCTIDRLPRKNKQPSDHAPVIVEI